MTPARNTKQLFWGLGKVSGGAFWGLGGSWKPKTASEGKCAKANEFFHRKWRERPFGADETSATLTKYRKERQKLAGDVSGISQTALRSRATHCMDIP